MYFPPTSDQALLWEQYCKEIEKRTNGQVKITYYPGSQLFDGPGTWDAVRKVWRSRLCHDRTCFGSLPRHGSRDRHDGLSERFCCFTCC